MTPISAPISMKSSPRRDREDAALTECESAEQDERDGRDADARGEPPEQADPEEERADLDEDERVFSLMGRLSRLPR